MDYARGVVDEIDDREAPPGEPAVVHQGLGLGVAATTQLVWILPPRLPEPEEVAQPDDSGC
jgi:hypothetical protein